MGVVPKMGVFVRLGETKGTRPMRWPLARARACLRQRMLAFLERQEVGFALKWMGYRWLLWFWCGGVLMESAAVVRTLRLGPLCLLHRGERDATIFRPVGAADPGLLFGVGCSLDDMRIGARRCRVHLGLLTQTRTVGPLANECGIPRT